MPKGVTITQSSSNNPSNDVPLYVYYCLCGEFVLVIDTKLAQLPHRRTDDAYVLRIKDGQGQTAQAFKLNATLNDPVLIKRSDEMVEKQYRFTCVRCKLPLGYQSTLPPARSGEFLYILQGACHLSQTREGDADI